MCNTCQKNNNNAQRFSIGQKNQRGKRFIPSSFEIPSNDSNITKNNSITENLKLKKPKTLEEVKSYLGDINYKKTKEPEKKEDKIKRERIRKKVFVSDKYEEEKKDTDEEEFYYDDKKKYNY